MTMLRVQTIAVAGILFAICFSPSHSCAADVSFETRSITGDELRLQDHHGQLTVVAFLGTECPLARIYGPRLQTLSESYRDRVRFIGVVSNRQDSMSDVQKYVRSGSIRFPFVHDVDNVIADQFDAMRTPEVFLLNTNLQVLYHGRIDDQYRPGVARTSVGREDLRIAIDETLAGKVVSVRETEVSGCLIGRVKQRREAASNEITFSEHVAPILHRHCIECHRTGDIGPFGMERYGEVAGWADTMMESIDQGRMPPWHADPDHGEFANQRQMQPNEIRMLREWIAGGLKEGSAEFLPSVPKANTGWQLAREPDEIHKMRTRPYRVPADGVVEYQYFVVDPKFKEDRWIAAAQVIPGNRSVVHHAIVFIRPPDGVHLPGVGWLCAYVPGQRMLQLPPGAARRVPAGSKFIFQMHYTPDGIAQDDVSKVGLLFADSDEVTHEAYTLIAINKDFEIPPHADNHRVSATLPSLPDEGELLAVTPHMHYRGRSFQMLVDETKKLSVPKYDFNWQHTYALKNPIQLGEVKKITIDCRFDNSKKNPFNPNPNEWVTWGDQTWEEMAIGFFEVIEPLKKMQESEEDSTSDDLRAAARRKLADEWVSRALRHMDANGDGTIAKSETSIIVRHFNFGNFDADDDGIVTREELTERARIIFSR